MPNFKRFIFNLVLMSSMSLFGQQPDSPKATREAVESICKVHHTHLRKIFVPIYYGYPKSAEDTFTEARSSAFPHSQMRVVFGGCEVQPEKTMLVSVCDECTQEQLKWLEHWPKWKTTKDPRIPLPPAP